MRKALLLTLIVLCSASLAFAQNGSIGLFSDPGATDCNLYDTVMGLETVYVVHVNAIGATASQFMVVADPCFTAGKVGENYDFTLVIGSFTGGISFSYQTCLTGNISLGNISYFGQGTSGTCCYLHVVPDPNAIPAGEVWTVDCNTPNNLVAVPGGEMVVNPDQSCMCTTPTVDSTWGKIKSMYE
jgi:hypothetical protein